jgi:hypothetical protein
MKTQKERTKEINTMYFKATFDKSGYTETVFITSEEGFHTYSKICGDAPLTINMEEQTIIVHEK